MLAIGYFRSVGPDETVEQLEQSFEQYCESYLHQATRVFVEASEEPPYPAYSRMIAHMTGSHLEFLVVVPDSNHLGDDLESVVRSVLELEGARAKVICSDEDLPDPFQNALSNLGVKNVSRQRSDRIKSSMRRRAIEGRSMGRPPYGYRNGPDGVLQIQSEEAEVVRLAYRLYTENNLGLRLIARELNEGGIKTRKGGRWNVVTLRDILRNPAYVGTYVRFGLRVPKSHEAIVAAETFRAAQDIVKDRKRRVSAPAGEPFLLSGVVYCAECGNKMMGVTRRQTWKRKDGRRNSRAYRYYQCQSRNNLSVCRYHTWRAEALEERTLALFQNSLTGKKTEPSVLESAESAARVRELSEQRLANAERSFLRTLRKVAAGKAFSSDLVAYLGELRDSRHRAAEPNLPPGDARAALEKWETLDLSDRQDLLRRHVDRFIVGDDTVELVL
ncbi:MAG: recombinase family protein [Chloroflexi bacterium]|nr:recombinase family protein [Chloroflexota bacterium]